METVLLFGKIALGRVGVTDRVVLQVCQGQDD